MESLLRHTLNFCPNVLQYRFKKQKQKYRGMFETQKSGSKTSSGDIGLNIRTLASPKEGQDQVSGVSVLCWHATPVANVLWKPLAIRLKVKFGNKVQISNRANNWWGPGDLSREGVLRIPMRVVKGDKNGASLYSPSR